jgi:hypothetical protein
MRRLKTFHTTNRELYMMSVRKWDNCRTTPLNFLPEQFEANARKSKHFLLSAEFRGWRISQTNFSRWRLGKKNVRTIDSHFYQGASTSTKIIAVAGDYSDFVQIEVVERDVVQSLDCTSLGIPQCRRASSHVQRGSEKTYRATTDGYRSRSRSRCGYRCQRR